MKLSFGQRLAIGAIRFGTPIAEAAGRLAGAAESMKAQLMKRGATGGQAGGKGAVGVAVGDGYLRDIYPAPSGAGRTVATRSHLERGSVAREGESQPVYKSSEDLSL